MAYTIVMLPLLYLLICSAVFAVGDEDVQFKFHGTIVLPSDGIYNHIPNGSCLYVSIKEEIMDDGNGKISCEKLMKKFNFIDNKMTFEIDNCQKLEAPLSIGLTLNIGWCQKDSDSAQWLKQGDYFNDVGYSVENGEKSLLVSKEMDLTLYGKSVLPQKDQNQATFKFYGIIILPASAQIFQKNISSNIRNGSCLHVGLQDRVMDDGVGKFSCAKVIREFNFISNRTYYWFVIEMDCINLGTTFSISAFLNVGWCRTTDDKKWIKDGDYYNDISYSIYETRGRTYLYKELKMKLFREEHPMIGGVKESLLQGMLALPDKGIYWNLPKSCIHIRVGDGTSGCVKYSCTNGIAWKTDVNEYRIYKNQLVFEVPMSYLEQGSYNVGVFVNTGKSCPITQSIDAMTVGDYTGFGNIKIQRDDNEKGGSQKLILNLVEEHKYMCGRTMCFRNEVCKIRGDPFTPYCSCPAYGCEMDSNWVCSNTGESFQNECLLQASDCFSGYVKKVDHGKCSTYHHFFGSKENTVSFTACLVASLCFLAAVILFVARYWRRRNSTTNNCQAKPTIDNVDIKKDQHFVDTDDDDVDIKKDQHFVDTDENCLDGFRLDDIPKAQPNVYEKPPAYEEACVA